MPSATHVARVKWLLAAIAAIVLVVVLVIGRNHARDAAKAEPPSMPAAVTASTGSALAPPAGHIKRITPEERRELDRKIETARATRTARAAASAAPERPALPASHEGGLENLPPGAFDMLKEALPYLGACYGHGATVTGPHGAIVLVSMHGDPDVGTLIDPGDMHDDNGVAIDPEIASCLTSTLQSLQLPPMVDGNTAQVQFSFRY